MTGAHAAIPTLLTNNWAIPSAAAVLSAARSSPHPPDRCVLGVLSAENPDNATVEPGDRSPLQALRSSPEGPARRGIVWNRNRPTDPGGQAWDASSWSRTTVMYSICCVSPSAPREIGRAHV